MTDLKAILTVLNLFVGFSFCESRLPHQPPPLEIVKQWNLVNFDLPWDFPGNDKNLYDPKNVVVTGLAITYDRIFIAMPRLFSGVAATVGVIARKDIGDSPLIQAYPDWSYHAAGRKSYNCSDIGLVSVYRMRIDSCNRLWLLDAGVSRSLEDYEITCPPKILVIDLNTDQVIRRIDFPREIVRGESLYTNMIIDETTSSPENHCDDVFVYISDTVEPAIIVYDSGQDLTWRVSHPAMYPDPNFAQTEILGQRFTLLDGIVGLAFDEKIKNVYFQPLATDRLFSISTAALRAGPLPFGAELPVKLAGKKSSQGIGLAVNPQDGSVIFSPMTETAVASWNPQNNDQKILSFDPDQLQFIADIVIPSTEPNSIFLVSSKFHRFFLKNLNVNEVNTRILRLENVAGNLIDNRYINNVNYIPQAPVFSSRPPNTMAFEKKKRPITFVDGYNVGSIRQPYPYEPVGIIDRSIKNPFNQLNTGEKPQVYIKTQIPNVPYQFYKTGTYVGWNGVRPVELVQNATIYH